MRKILVAVFVALPLAVLAEDVTTARRELEDYALRAALENLAVLSYVQKGKAEELPSIANVNLQSHLTALRESGDAITDPGWIGAKVRVLNAIGLMWKVSPPDKEMKFNDPELSAHWKATIEANMTLIEWAYKECTSHPEYECKAFGN